MQTVLDAMRMNVKFTQVAYNSQYIEDRDAWLHAEVEGLLANARKLEAAYMEHLGVDVPSSEGVEDGS